MGVRVCSDLGFWWILTVNLGIWDKFRFIKFHISWRTENIIIKNKIWIVFCIFHEKFKCKEWYEKWRASMSPSNFTFAFSLHSCCYIMYHDGTMLMMNLFFIYFVLILYLLLLNSFIYCPALISRFYIWKRSCGPSSENEFIV